MGNDWRHFWLSQVAGGGVMSAMSRVLRTIIGIEENMTFLVYLIRNVIQASLLSGCFQSTSKLFLKNDDQFLCKDTKKDYFSNFSFQAHEDRG